MIGVNSGAACLTIKIFSAVASVLSLSGEIVYPNHIGNNK